MDKFTDKLLSLDVFNCGSCHKLLNTPVKLVQDIGNVCNDCYEKNKWIGIPNITLETILEQFEFPCKFHHMGCSERIIFNELSTHERVCKYNQRPCLMSAEGCDWEGMQSDLHQHFTHCHSDHIITSRSNTFTFDLNISGTVHVIKLLKGQQEVIIKIEQQNNFLQYTMSTVKNFDAIYVIEHKGSNNNCVTVRCEVSAMNGAGNLERIDMDSLRQITDAQTVISLKIYILGHNKVNDFNEKMLHYFECPVCKTIMRPPIYQCNLGHSFCNICKPRLEKCPTCRALFGHTRNYSLEGLTAGINYSCMYHPLGCEVDVALNDAEKHESVCPYKPYPCPLENCVFRGTYSSIGKHMDEVHRDQVISAAYFKTNVEFRLEQMIDCYNFQKKYFMVFDENIFRLSFKRNSDYSFWAVEVLKKREVDAVFTYEIGIVDLRKPDRKLIRCDLCLTETNCDDLFKKCILFPNNILASYSCNGMFTYYCQIHKRD